MAEFTPSKKTAQDFNNGVEYIDGQGNETGDVFQAEAANNLVEGVLYSQEQADIAVETATSALEKINEVVESNVVPTGNYPDMKVGYATRAGTVSSITIQASSWNNKSATISVDGMFPSSNVFVSPDDESAEAWLNSGVKASSQANGSITFTCMTTPTVSAQAIITILN